MTFVASPHLSEYAATPRVCHGAPCWPHAPVAVMLERLRSQEVLTRLRRFKKPATNFMGTKREIPKASFSWQVGQGEPADFETGLREWLGVFEGQLCALHDVKSG